MTTCYAQSSTDWASVDWRDAPTGGSMVVPSNGDTVELNGKAVALSPTYTVPVSGQLAAIQNTAGGYLTIIASGSQNYRINATNIINNGGSNMIQCSGIGTGTVTINCTDMTNTSSSLSTGLLITSTGVNYVITGNCTGGTSASKAQPCVSMNGANNITINGLVKGGSAAVSYGLVTASGSSGTITLGGVNAALGSTYTMGVLLGSGSTNSISITNGTVTAGAAGTSFGISLAGTNSLTMSAGTITGVSASAGIYISGTASSANITCTSITGGSAGGGVQIVGANATCTIVANTVNGGTGAGVGVLCNSSNACQITANLVDSVTTAAYSGRINWTPAAGQTHTMGNGTICHPESDIVVAAHIRKGFNRWTGGQAGTYLMPPKLGTARMKLGA